MADLDRRPLKVFLCHASGDKPYVRDLYKRLTREGVDAWLDQEKLLPGQDWRVEIPRAVKEADVVVICLSNKSITKEGYIQKEIKFALDSADEKPDGTIFLIPARIEDCSVPEKLSRWHWVDLFEEDGYIKLLRSLKLRADRVGATVAPYSYEDADAETERRLDQFYTEGLAAFYTEDWNKACQRFQAILSERPNHRNALEKLEEAEKRRDLSKLYTQATNAYQAQNWETAIATLDQLLKKSPEYNDAVQLLKHAKKQEQLGGLYFEAGKLHGGGKWQAVLKVFEQIRALEPNYPDPEGLLPSAEKEAAELKRIADLNELYSRALREMDLGKWREARTLLEQIHKLQTGFLETERLLRKAEDELKKVEEQTRRVNEVNILYEQAHGLVRAKNWRKALDKIEEIRKLESDFADRDGIVEKIRAALTHEEEQVQKQDHLAAMYAEAVRLLKEEKYAETLTKWGEIRALDSKYPDRRRVERSARNELAKAGKAAPARRILVSWKTVVPAAAILGLLLAAIFYEDIIPYTGPGKEYPIRIKIFTSSDWARITTLAGGGELTNVKLLESNSQSTVNEYRGYFTVDGPVGSAGSGAVAYMLAEAVLLNADKEGNLAFEFDGGCVGETTIEFWNAVGEPVLVESVTGLSACGGQEGKIEIPITLFTNEEAASELTPSAFTSYAWYFTGDSSGWGSVTNHISTPLVLDGLLTFMTEGGNPYIVSPRSLQISSSITPIITVRFSVSTQDNSLGAIYFVTDKDGNWDETKKKVFSLRDGKETETYNIDMSTVSTWKDVITQIRLHPQQATVGGIEIQIDSITIHAP